MTDCAHCHQVNKYSMMQRNHLQEYLSWYRACLTNLLTFLQLKFSRERFTGPDEKTLTMTNFVSWLHLTFLLIRIFSDFRFGVIFIRLNDLYRFIN